MTNPEKLVSLQKELDKLDERENNVKNRFSNVIFQIDEKEFEARKLKNQVTRLEYREEYDKEQKTVLKLIEQLNKIRNDIKKSSELLNIAPNYDIPIINELNDKIKKLQSEIPKCVIPYPQVEEFVNFYKYNALLTHYKIIKCDIDAHRIILEKKLKKIKEIVAKEEWTIRYKKYAEENNLEVNDDNIFAVCNKHKMDLFLEKTTFECTCPLYDRNDWAADHTVNIADGICNFGSCMYPTFIMDIDNFMGFIEYPYPEKLIKLNVVKLTEYTE